MPFDGCNSKSIVIMDNCSIHYVHQVKDFLHETGVLVLYLPPYSPDLNPIELAFSCIKQYLKQHEDIMHVLPAINLVKAAFRNINKELCNAWIENIVDIN